jgi:acyl-CoA synthetase (AMP-forming)/AMP-acid ligase II
MIFETAVADPGGVALDDLTRRRSWAELLERTTRIAHLLRDELRVTPGEHVALLMGNRVEFVELTLGAILAGVWITPINWHLKGAETAYVVEDSGAKVVHRRGAPGDGKAVGGRKASCRSTRSRQAWRAPPTSRCRPTAPRAAR